MWVVHLKHCFYMHYNVLWHIFKRKNTFFITKFSLLCKSFISVMKSVTNKKVKNSSTLQTQKELRRSTSKTTIQQKDSTICTSTGHWLCQFKNKKVKNWQKHTLSWKLPPKEEPVAKPSVTKNELLQKHPSKIITLKREIINSHFQWDFWINNGFIVTKEIEYFLL